MPIQFLRRAAHWQVPLGLAVAAAIAAAFGPAGQDWLRYEQSAVAGGELWRLLTAHVVHLGTAHLLMNLAGLVLVWLLVGRLYGTRQWLIAVLVCIAAMDVGFWFVEPGVRWYVGLSGLLHGLLLAGAIGGMRSLPGESLVIAGLVVSKLAYEQLVGPLPGSESTAGGPVLVDAHLYGAIGGVIFALVFRRRGAGAASI